MVDDSRAQMDMTIAASQLRMLSGVRCRRQARLALEIGSERTLYRLRSFALLAIFLPLTTVRLNLIANSLTGQLDEDYI